MSDTQQQKKTRTITLTDRPPVRIVEDEWPVIASAEYYEHDGQVESQANRVWRGHITVRHHEDGRAIVYGRSWFSTQFRNERDYERKAGELLPAEADSVALIAAIHRVHERIEVDHPQWATLARECIADLPAVEI